MTDLDQAISRLAHLPPSQNPVISCFVNIRPEGQARPLFMPFLKKAFTERLRSFPERSEAARHIEADRDRILEFLSGKLDPAFRAASIHASAADGLWETHTFHATFYEERVVVGPVPHLYPLVRLADQSPLYAVCVADSRQARIVVCGLGEVLTEEDFEGPEPIDRTRVAGWAEVRYQSRIEAKIHKNAKEIIERLEKIVERDEVDYVIVGGDDLILGELRKYFTPAIRAKLIDEEHISIDESAHEILRRTLRVVRDTEARDSRRLADLVIDRFRAGGLAVAGIDPTIEALNLEQVDQLLLAESFNGDEAGWQCPECRVLGRAPAPEACPFCAAPLPEPIELREAMVRRAERTGRKVEIVETHAELQALDGVGATLRYRV